MRPRRSVTNYNREVPSANKRMRVLRALALRRDGWAGEVVYRRVGASYKTLHAWAQECGITWTWKKKKGQPCRPQNIAELCVVSEPSASASGSQSDLTKD